MSELAVDRADQIGIRATGFPSTCLTAGQRTATDDLRAVIAARRPLVLLFGDTGSGKTSVIEPVLVSADPQQVVAVHLSATGSEFPVQPTFDTLLKAVHKRLGAPAAPDQRPASLAGLATTVGAVVDAGKTVVMCIDQADRLSDEVIVEVARLHEYLDVPPAAVLRIFVGSIALASRIDAALRRTGIGERLAEIRLSQPTADEVAAILAYEDGAHPAGPMLTAEAVDRIGAYAKSNLHWAAPMADAARMLATSTGALRVTPELVREALLDIWSPDEREVDEARVHDERCAPVAVTVPVQDETVSLGLADVDRPPPISAAASPVPSSDISDVRSAASHGFSQAVSKPRVRRALKTGIAVLALLVGLGAATYLLGHHGTDIDRPAGGSAGITNRTRMPEPVPPPSAPPSLFHAEDVSAGAAASSSGEPEDAADTRVNAPVETDFEADARASAGEPETGRGAGAAGEDGEGTLADVEGPVTVPAESGREPERDVSKAGASLKPKVAVPPPPKKPDERTSTPWVQVR